MSGLGINVVRTWGFCNSCGANSIQTAVLFLLLPFYGSGSRELSQAIRLVYIWHVPCQCVQTWLHAVALAT